MIERVKLLMSVKNLSSSQFAETINVQRSGISHILSGRNKPSLDFVLKLLNAFPDLNESWLLKGDGEMLKASEIKQNRVLFDEKEAVSESEEIKNRHPDKSAYHKTVFSDIKGDSAGETLHEKEVGNSPNKLIGNKIEEVANVIIEKENTLSDSDKKLVKLIAIFDDDSFKVYHSE